MIAHIVLFSPKPELGAADRHALVEALEAACRDIPGIRRARVGRRRAFGYEYDAWSPVSFEFAAVLEFDSESDLHAYLHHPAHQALGVVFRQVAQAAVAHDYEVVDASDVGSVARIAGLT